VVGSGKQLTVLAWLEARAFSVRNLKSRSAGACRLRRRGRL